MEEIERLIDELDELFSPLLIEIVGLLGAVVSLIMRVIPSEAEAETFPATSLNQTYTVREWLPMEEELESVKETLSEKLVLPETKFHPEWVEDGFVFISDK